MIDQLMLFRVILALTAWLAIFYDNYKHRDLRLVAYAYTFLVLGTVSSVFYIIYQDLWTPSSYFFEYLTHIFAVLVAGLLFALTAYSSNRHMKLVEEKVAKAFRK